MLAARIGTLPFAHHQVYLDEVVTVEDEALPGAMRVLLDKMKLVVEPSGAITVAALREGIVRPEGKAVTVVSGGNIEWDGLRALLGTGGLAHPNAPSERESRRTTGQSGTPAARPA